MIISGGVNIFPQEIENVRVLHPAITDVAVIGIPDPDMGEQVKAIVQLLPGMERTDNLAEELIAFVKNRIAGYKAPSSIDFAHEVPRSQTGKLMKQELRNRFGRRRQPDIKRLEWNGTLYSAASPMPCRIHRWIWSTQRHAAPQYAQ